MSRLPKLHLAIVCWLGSLTIPALAQDLDVQATLEPFSEAGGIEHGRLVLRIHNETGNELSGIQIRLDGSYIDLAGNRVMQLDRLAPSSSAFVFENYTTLPDSAELLLPLRIRYSGPAGEQELRTVSPAWTLDSGEEQQ